ncbi:hypothetical protein BJX68DRAFT_244774 [Aspergillus pseudodeflectus]|uniref:Uncharacterized protein n=1 Tax=Aspergillus pseudodeflectus TaxID=176178 RepID=A0ABR4JR32_9EURO
MTLFHLFACWTIRYEYRRCHCNTTICSLSIYKTRFSWEFWTVLRVRRRDWHPS